MDRPKTRRRGAELETAILAATWTLLCDSGYRAVTFEAVAAAAHTSRSVLYRRWGDVPALVVAALSRYSSQNRLEYIDTGSLRGDVLAVLHETNDRRRDVFTAFALRLSGFYSDTGMSPERLRHEMLGDRTPIMQSVVDAARARGEITHDLPPSVRDLPFTLFRSEAIMSLAPVDDDTITSIVDDVWLPLVAHYEESPISPPR